MAQDFLFRHMTVPQVNAYILSLDLLRGTGVPPGGQLACLYAVSRDPGRHYRRALLPRLGKAPRRLLVPDALLMQIQRNLLRAVLAPRPVSPYATAYRQGLGPLDGARPHVGQDTLLTLDIADFFGSITVPMVYRDAFPAALFPRAARGLFANLCCAYECLPQGAPTSPAVSNLALRAFDLELGAWCAARDIRYTRYCDDMAFSGDFDPRAVMESVRRRLYARGFQINKSKTRVLRQANRQCVTGIVVNDHPQVPRAYRRALRQAVHYCARFGPAAHLARQTGHAPEPQAVRRYLQSLIGQAGYILQINPDDADARAQRDLLRGWLQGGDA